MGRRKVKREQRNIKRQHRKEVKKRYNKMKMVAASVVVGGYSLKKAGLDNAIKNGLLEVAGKTVKGFKKDLLNKPKNLRTLSDAYNNNIGEKGKVIKEALKNRKTDKAVNTQISKKIKTYVQNKEDLLRQVRSKKYNADAKEEFVNRILARTTDKETQAQLRDMMDSLYGKATKENIDDGTIFNKFTKAKNIKDHTEQDVKDILHSMVQWREDNRIDDKTLHQKADKFVEKRTSEYLNKMHRDRSWFQIAMDTVTGTRPMTVEDLHDVDPEFLGKIRYKTFDGHIEQRNVAEMLKAMAASDDKYKDLVIDEGLRIAIDSDGNKTIIDHRELHAGVDEFIKKAKDTLPGKILFKNVKPDQEHAMGFVEVGKSDINAYLTGAKDGIMKETMFFQEGKLYGLITNANGELDIDMSRVIDVTEVVGYKRKTLQELIGSRQIPIERSTSALAQIFDINQDGVYNLRKNIDRTLGLNNDPNWEKNELLRMRRFVNTGQAGQELETKALFYNSAVTTSNILNKNITGVSDELLDNLIQSGHFTDGETEMLQWLLDGSNDSMFNFVNNFEQMSHLKNKRLVQMLDSILKNEANTVNEHVSIKNSKYNPLFGMELEERWVRDEVGQFRVEFVKELLMKDHRMGTPMMDIIEDVAQNQTQARTLESIGMLGMFEHYMKIDGPIAADVTARFNSGGSEGVFGELIRNDSRLHHSFNEIMSEAIDSYSIMDKPFLDKVNEVGFYSEFNDVMFVNKTRWNVKDIIKNINETLEDKDFSRLTGMAKGMIKEVTIAGRHNPEYVTEATIYAQYAMSRLNYSLAEFGLNLSHESMASPLATFTNFALKRILPVAAGMTAFSYLNDESRRFTGTSITEAAARGMSYVDIAARRLAYATPFVGSRIEDWAETSVIHEYWFGSNHFQDADERREWYENGYSPVRKGRFWSFGSSSEYRGGAISYWQPNYLRRAESNYHDISVYGSSEEKWAHSWIPTPTHPLSTLRAALNPYWLEKKHLKENDRPYPVSSKLFAEGTPWGAILNPTVGEILKPVRMMPEARLRLGSTGRDAKAIINRLNEKAKSKELGNDDLIIVSGTDIRNAEYIPFGNPVGGEVNVTFYNGQPQVRGYGFMDDLPTLRQYEAPTGGDYIQQSPKTGQRAIIGRYEESTTIRTLNQMVESSGNSYAESLGKQLIQNINNSWNNRRNKQRRYAGVVNDRNNSSYIYRNLVNEYNNYIDNWYGERRDPYLVESAGGIRDFSRDALYSTGQISGIYGYLAGVATGSDTKYSFRYENADQMTSFSRGFWDASIGGLGAGPMEIARRFFPSQQKNRINVNPLVNNMPDWIPESYRTGDPYTQIPKGEMRLPGKGYEAMYDLHPDEFGEYGAFDRFKILADIAPNSAEYKKWKTIAKGTVTDKALIKEMDQITERAAKMSGNHEFFEYKYMRNSTTYSKGIVKSVSGSNITLADNTIISLAGVKATSNTGDALSTMVQPGMEITYRHDKNRVYSSEDAGKNTAISAVVYADSGQSLNQNLIRGGHAEKDVEDNSTIAQLGRISASQEASGAIQELIAHAPIPIIHNKFLKVESAYESYVKETVVGSPFKTWDHPIKGFVKPMLNEMSYKSPLSAALSAGVAYKHFSDFVHRTDKQTFKGMEFKQSTLSTLALVATNPAAFLGGNINFILHMSNGGKGRGQELTNWQKGAKAGAMFSTVKYIWDNSDNVIQGVGMFAGIGAFLGSKKDFGWEVIEDFVGPMSTKKGLAIGAGIGLTVSALKNQGFMNPSKAFGKWIPKETRKKWEIDEYFDRLEYIKYSGLYEKAAKKARKKEKVDIKGLFKEIDKNKKKIGKLNVKASKLINKVEKPGDKYDQELQEIEQKKRYLEEQSNMMFQGGEYTKSAIAYKKKMESTMYGMTNAATKDEILSSVPVQYKDYYAAFINITDKKEQKKILKSMSPMMRRPLQAAWGMKLERRKPHALFFSTHALPGTGWRGWKPNVNLKYVKMKTIENEGMLLSDFGYYESEKAKATFEDAPDIKNYRMHRGFIANAASVRSTLRGRGLICHNVSIERTRAPGVSIVGDIKEKTEDQVHAAGYRVSSLAYHLGSLF